MGLFRELFHKSRKNQNEISDAIGYTKATTSLLKHSHPPYFIKLQKAMEVLGVDNLEATEGDLIIKIQLKCKE
jgi:hypothetical protein